MVKKTTILAIVLTFVGCNNKAPFKNNNLAYKTIGERPAEGIVIDKVEHRIEYLTYKNGKLLNKKKSRSEGNFN